MWIVCVKYIAQYFGVMNGADAIVFTAGIGENSADVRASVFWMVSLGLVLKWILKRMFSDVLAILQQQIQLLKCLLFQRDEELVIARDVERLKTK